MQPISEEVLIVSQCQWRHRPEPSVKQLWYFRHKKKCSENAVPTGNSSQITGLNTVRCRLTSSEHQLELAFIERRKSIIQLWVDATPIIFVKKYFICERDFFLYWKHKNAKYLDLD